MRLKAAPGGGGPGAAQRRVDGDAGTYLAFRLYGDNPRLPVIIDGRPVAMLKLVPARNVRHRSSARGERVEVGGVLGAAMVLHFDVGIEFDAGDELRVRVFSPAELRRFAQRLLEYAELLELANVVGADAQALAERYFGGGAPRRRGGGGPDGEPAAGAAEAAEEEEVEVV